MNPDHAFIASFLRGGGSPARIVTNPVANALNAMLLAADVSGSVTVAFEAGRQFLQGGQVLQGGILTVMLDFAMAFAAQAILPAEDAVATATATANLNISILRPASAGGYRAIGRVVKRGRTLIFGSAELHNNDGVMVASSTGVMAVIRT